MTGTPQMDFKNNDRRLQGASFQGMPVAASATASVHALQSTATRLLKGAY